MINIETYKDYRKLTQSIGSIQKSGVNPHFKNSYVELNTAIDVVNEHLEENNFICFLQTPKNIEGKNYLNTILVHNNGDVIEGDLELITVRNDPQMLGSSLTYARRYSLLTILGLKAVDDDGELASGRDNKLTNLTPLKKRMDKKGKEFTLDQYLSGFKKEGMIISDEDVRLLKKHYDMY